MSDIETVIKNAKQKAKEIIKSTSAIIVEHARRDDPVESKILNASEQMNLLIKGQGEIKEALKTLSDELKEARQLFGLKTEQEKKDEVLF